MMNSKLENKLAAIESFEQSDLLHQAQGLERYELPGKPYKNHLVDFHITIGVSDSQVKLYEDR